MDRDTFMSAVYGLVVEPYQAVTDEQSVRHGGFAPALSDAEVITMEIRGAYFKLSNDKDLWHYFRTHYRHFCPALGDRTLFVRQAANLWQIKAAIQQHLTHISGQANDAIQPLDTLPLSVCVPPVASATAASNPMPPLATVPPSRWTLMASSSAYVLKIDTLDSRTLANQ